MTRVDLLIALLVLALVALDGLVRLNTPPRRTAIHGACTVVADSANYRGCQCWRFAESPDSLHFQADCGR